MSTIKLGDRVGERGGLLAGVVVAQNGNVFVVKRDDGSTFQQHRGNLEVLINNKRKKFNGITLPCEVKPKDVGDLIDDWVEECKKDYPPTHPYNCY